MNDLFSAEIYLYVIRDGKDGEYEVEDSNLVSTIPDLRGMIDITAALYYPLAENDEVKSLKDGFYLVFLHGNVWYEPDQDWETGLEEGEFLFDVESIKILRLKDIEPRLRDGYPCQHPGCLSHISHPCEVCGRIGGITPKGVTF